MAQLVDYGPKGANVWSSDRETPSEIWAHQFLARQPAIPTSPQSDLPIAGDDDHTGGDEEAPGCRREFLGDAGVSFLPALTASMTANSRRTEQKYARKMDFKCETLRRC